MNHLPTGLAIATMLAAAVLLGVVPATGATISPSGAVPVQFGMDSAALGAQAKAGVPADYGTFWVGPWTLTSGWGGPDNELTTMKNQGVTPAIHFYYWGDDITPTCVENGCWSGLHNTQKTRAGWDTLATQMTDHLTAKMGGEPVVIFLESEFNKAGISTYEPFDGYMAAMANKIHAGYPNAIVVLGFGAWDSGNWYRFDQAAAASDMVGVQGMRGSTKDSATHYNSIYEGTLAHVQKLDSLFDKPIMLTDIALSSYPEPSYLAMQADNLGEIFANLGTLKANGVEAMIYRSWLDSPNMNLANYYGEAERHWGLSSATQAKSSAQVWIDGVKAERAAVVVAQNVGPSASFTATGGELSATFDASASSDTDGDALSYAWTFGDGTTGSGVFVTHAYATAGTYTIGLTVSDGALTSSASKSVTATAPPPPEFTATFAPKGNEWWVEVAVTGNAPVAKVEAKAGSGAWTVLPKQSWDAYAKSFNVPKGTPVTFRATATDGQVETSETQPWMGAATTTTTTSTTTAPSDFTAAFTPKGNEWWVEVKVTGNAPVAKVEAKAGSGAWTVLPKQSWDAYAKSFNVPKGTPVTFRATATDGQVETSETQPWMGAATAPTAPAFAATFTPKSQSNNWWIEAAVSANEPITKVETKVNAGAWTVLPKSDWGAYAKSINAPDGAQVAFRATNSAGATSLSAAYTWG